MLKRLLFAAAFAVASIASAFAQGQFQPGQVQGNPNAAAGQGLPSSITSILDRALGSTRGAILERGASGWAIVGPGSTSGLPWVSGGAGADPAYQALSISGSGLTGFGTGVVTALGVNVGTAGAFVVNGGALGVPSSGTLTNATGLPLSTGITGFGTGVATALGVNVGTAGSVVVNGGALGTPSSGSMLNLASGPASHAVPVDVAGTPTYKIIPDCQDSAGNHINYTQSTDAFSCGTTSSTASTIPGFQNCSLAASVSSNNLTIALKDNTGADPSVGSPCIVWFANSTLTTGSWVQRTVTSAQSITLNSSSTLGTANNTPFRIWIELFDSGSTAVLGVNVVSTTTTFGSLSEWQVYSTTACASCSSATSSGVFYTASALSSKPLVLLGWMEWGSGLATAGTWASGPTSIRSFFPGSRRPGDIVQAARASSTTATNTTSTSLTATTLAVSITPTSASNAVVCSYSGSIQTNDTGNSLTMALLRGGSTIGHAKLIANGSTVGSFSLIAAVADTNVWDFPGVTTSQTYTVNIASGVAGKTVTWLGSGVPNEGSDIGCLEVMQ